MNRIIVALLVLVLGINIYGFFLKDSDLLMNNDLAVMTSESCINLNEVETFSCLKEIELQGNANGNDLMLLGQLHRYGMGTIVDLPQAILMFEKSVVADQNSDAMRLLGDIFVNNDNDLVSAKYWYARAAKNNDIESAIKLANIYRYGKEKDVNPEEALRLYKKAADLGSLDAQYEAALMYAMGVGISPNLDRSIFMFEGLCDKNHADSCALQSKILELKQSK